MSQLGAAPPAVEVEGLTRNFGSQRAVDGLTLCVRRGGCLGLLGPNGAGKTTTIRILSTQLAAGSGRVRVLGLDPLAQADQLRARIGVVPQELALYDDLTARENLEFFGRTQGLSGARLRERTAWALEQAGLTERAGERVAAFSGGMKRRLNLVTSLLHEPELVFLDEPTVGVDPQSRLRVFELVAGLRERGVTLIYTTHLLGEVERLCDRIVIMDRGRAVAQGTLSELRSLSGIAADGSLRLRDAGRTAAAAELLRSKGFELLEDQGGAGLEQVFLALTGHALRDGEG